MAASKRKKGGSRKSKQLAGAAIVPVEATHTVGLTVGERIAGLSKKQKLLIGGGIVGLVLLFIFRKQAKTAATQVVATATTAAKSAGAAIVTKFGDFISAAEKAVLSTLTPAGREGYVNAAFAVGPQYGIDPWLLVGILKIESDFGRALTTSAPGAFNGQTVETGDFIPRPAIGKDAEVMAKYPLPGCKKVYWERPQIGNLKAYKGEMFVPAHDLRVAAAGGDLKKAYTRNGGVKGGIGWGFTPWQLDWRSFAPQLLAGAAWDQAKATEAALSLIKANIAYGKKSGFSGDNLVKGVIAAYNAGAGVFDKIKSSGKSADAFTASPKYTTLVFDAAKKAGKTIQIA